MATYQYGGKTYSLADGLTNEAALSKIKTSLGEASAPVAAPGGTAAPPIDYSSQIPTSQGANTTPTVSNIPPISNLSTGDQIGRQIGLTARAGLTGITAVPAMMADFLTGTGGLLTGKAITPSSQALQDLMTRIGIPEPQGQFERSVQAGAGAMTGTGLQAAASRGIPALAAFTTNLPQQIGAAAGGGLAGQTAADMTTDMTGSPLLGVAAGLAGGVAGGAPALLKNPLAPVKAGISALQESLEASQAQKAQAASALDYQSSARIDAVNAARSLPEPISLNPSQSNPTTMNKASTLLAGQDKVNSAAVTANKNKWGNNAKADMGIARDVQLTPSVFEAIRTSLAAPYREVAKMGVLTPSEAVTADIHSIKIPDIISDAAAAPAVQNLVTRTLNLIDNGMTGDEALMQIKQLRDEVNNITAAESRGTVISPVDRAQAKAKKTIANSLEDLLESNVPADNPQLLSDFKDARMAMKKTFQYQGAFNQDTGLLDPTKLPSDMTGIGGDMRTIAANFPDSSIVRPTSNETLITRLSRGGVAGTLGMAFGSLTGLGAIPMAVAGTTAGEVLGSRAARNMTTDAYQTKRAVPNDRRIPYVEPEAPPAAPQAQLGSGGYIPETPFTEQAPRQGPNWNYGASQEPGPGNMPALPAPSWQASSQGVIADWKRQGILTDKLQAAVEASKDRTLGVLERKTIEDAITKTQDKIKGFAEIEARAATMQTLRDAQIKREKLMDTVQQLQDTLQARPTSRGAKQGPQTRLFQQENPTNKLDVSFGFTPEEMRAQR